MSDTMPAEIAAVFAAQPHAHAVLVEMGHAYGKAKFPGVCRVSDLPITVGGTIRKLDFWTRTGRHFSGYVPARTAELVEFRGGGATVGDLAISSWQFWGAEGFGDLDLASLPIGASFSTMKVEFGAMDATIQTWACILHAGRRVWRKRGTLSDTTDAQLQASMKRTKKLVAFRVSEQ